MPPAPMLRGHESEKDRNTLKNAIANRQHAARQAKKAKA